MIEWTRIGMEGGIAGLKSNVSPPPFLPSHTILVLKYYLLVIMYNKNTLTNIPEQYRSL